jgi:hypothetical protein
MSNEEQPPNNDLTRLIGLILVVIGTLWLALTGLCTTAFALGLLGEGNLGDVTVILTIAIPSTLIGGLIYAIGRWLRPK